VEETLERLVSLEVLKKVGSNYERQSKHISSTVDTMNKAVQEHHKKVLELAINQLEKQAVEDREYNGVTLNIRKKDISKIKLSLRELVDQVIQEFEAPAGEGEDTYQLNMQFFSNRFRINTLF
jgi:uncharacterized protein (TIGR02147 family)